MNVFISPVLIIPLSSVLLAVSGLVRPIFPTLSFVLALVEFRLSPAGEAVLCPSTLTISALVFSSAALNTMAMWFDIVGCCNTSTVAAEAFLIAPFCFVHFFKHHLSLSFQLFHFLLLHFDLLVEFN